MFDETFCGVEGVSDVRVACDECIHPRLLCEHKLLVSCEWCCACVECVNKRSELLALSGSEEEIAREGECVEAWERSSEVCRESAESVVREIKQLQIAQWEHE